jgi:hypothetical protein
MQFLLSHWHCILPAVGIVAAIFLMRGKAENGGKSDDKRQEWPPARYDCEDK